jgi:hypothetical protein
MKSDGEMFQTVLGFLALILLCGGVGTCKRWQYNECKKVGHGTAYCSAQTAGCFDGGGSK